MYEWRRYRRTDRRIKKCAYFVGFVNCIRKKLRKVEIVSIAIIALFSKTM